MRKVIVNEWMTLDGVIQAPGYPDEDRSGGFEHGGWHMPFFDDLSRQWVVDGYASAGGFLFGRRTYELLASYWPNAAEEERPSRTRRTTCRSTWRRRRVPGRSSGSTQPSSGATSPRR